MCMPYRDDDAARAELDTVRRRATLPLLERIEVASPCSRSWDAMMGDDRMRACGACKQHVFNLSAMTAAEAEQLILERAGVACVRYFQRADGTILLADCTIGRRRKTTATLAVAGLVTVLAGGGLGY